MTKVFIFAFGILLIIGVLFTIRGSEDRWICQEGEWVKHGYPSAPMPEEPCNQLNREATKEQEEEKKDESSGMFGALDKAKEINKSSKTLDISNQGHKTLTTEFFENKDNVEIFNVSRNLLTGALPAEIRKMSNLKELYASNNNLTGIPAEIGQLDNLEILDFSHNDIDTMPNELINLADTLKELNLSGNKYSPEQIEAFQVMLPATTIIAE